MTKSWRDVLPIHPACELFPLMTPAELRELGEDIKGNGLRRPIAITSDGQLLDGRNRLAAMEVAGVDFKIKRTRNGSPEIHIDIVGGDLSFAEVVTSDPVAFVISANIHRRHLTAEQKREHIARLIKATPGKSDWQIAETVKSNRTTVGQIRKVLEKAGDVSIVDTRTDTKGRKQPAKKPPRRPAQKRREIISERQDLVRTLIALDRGFAETLAKFFQAYPDQVNAFFADLAIFLDEGNNDPDASAEAMKAIRGAGRRAR